MEGVYLERKCFYIGCWKDDTVADNIIRQVAGMVRSGKGTKCKLTLSGEGLKVITSTVMSGKSLKDSEKFSNIHFATVNQYNPQCLLFITKDAKRKYRIIAIRCLNETDTALFVSCFRDLRRYTLKSSEGENTLELKQIESGNWTLRAKHPSTDKRQLNTIVEMNGEKMNVHLKQNGVIKSKRTAAKSNVDISVAPSTNENNNNDKETDHVERKDSNTVATQAGEPNGNIESNSNSVTEQELGDELNDLSHELREIKYVLETSAGIGADVYHDKDKNEIQIDQKTEEPEVKIETELLDPVSPISAEILDDDSSENDDKENEDKMNGNANELNESKAKESVTSDESEVKVVVPDYRSSGTQTRKYVRRFVPKENHTTVVTNEPTSPRLSTMSYDSWKEDVVLRGKVAPRTVRPRSAYVSTSSNGSSLQGSLRDRNPHIIYTTTSRTHHTLPHHSLRVPMRRASHLSSTIERPIEKVYPRPKSVHGSIVYRPVGGSQKGTIYAIPTTPRRVYVDKNHNKIEMNGPRLSGSVIQEKKNVKGDAVIIKT